jgi:hypothetical protein
MIVLVGFSSLNEVERETVRQSMQAVLNGSWIDDAEFGIRLGFERGSLKKILDSWPLFDDSAEGLVSLAINNCMNEVCHGINISGDEWNVWFTQSKDEVKATFSRWLNS